MLRYTTGNIIDSETEAIVNTVNTHGVMGKGIALAFKNAFPLNYKLYQKACKDGTIDIGKLLITETGQLYPKYIINFPTKKHWRYPSKYEYIEAGLKDLLRIIKEYNIKSISVPPLGSGNGRLEWPKVKQLILSCLSDISEHTDVLIFEPGFNEQPAPEKKKVALTCPRALFIYVLANYRILDYQINLLVTQKIAYFMQLFGENLNLQFEKGYYGPYSDKLNHLLKYINNSYIQYDSGNNSPATEITIISENFQEVVEYYNNQTTTEQKQRTERLLSFIEGFESPYGLELLATIHFIAENTSKKTTNEILEEIGNWTNRKKELMKPRHIEVALSRLREFDLV